MNSAKKRTTMKTSKKRNQEVVYDLIPPEEDGFLPECVEIIRECAKLPAMEGSILPIETTYKRNLIEIIKGEKKKETREIYFAQINRNGVDIEWLEDYTGRAHVIGMIDDDKMFIYSAFSGNLEVYTMNEYAYDHMGDFYYGTGSVIKYGLNPKFEQIRSKVFEVSRTRTRKLDEFIVGSQHETEEYYFNLVKLGELVGQMRRECVEKNKEPVSLENSLTK